LSFAGHSCSLVRLPLSLLISRSSCSSWRISDREAGTVPEISAQSATAAGNEHGQQSPTLTASSGFDAAAAAMLCEQGGYCARDVCTVQRERAREGERESTEIKHSYIRGK
jgi:hypothetical protein